MNQEIWIADFIQRALAEDLGDGDHTALACIPAQAQGRARLLVKEAGIIAGVELALAIFKALDPSLVCRVHIADGSPVEIGDVVLEVEGLSRSILQAERTVLNVMQRMSGIASLTRQFVRALAGTEVKLLDTRKTTPSLRLLEKLAVRLGGGENYRFGLYDRIMIKDNHIDFCGGLSQALTKVKDYLAETGRDLAITVEVRNQKELEEALALGGMQRLMLDNYQPQDLGQAIASVGGRYELEVSGGINLENIRAYAQKGIDYISVGALTHSFRSLDLSLKEF